MKKQKQKNNADKMKTDSIENFEQYEQALIVLQRLETALAALRQRIEPVNPELFEAMAQTYENEITEIRNKLDEFKNQIK